MGTPTQALCTIRDVEELGASAEALATLPARQKQSAIRAASGLVAAPLRKHSLFPLSVSAVDLDTSGLTAGGTAAITGTPALVADVAVKVLSGGTVGFGSLGVAVSRDASVTFGPVSTLPSSGVVVIDGVTLTLSGYFADDDIVTWGAEVDAGIKGIVALVAADILMVNRGADAKTNESMADRHKMLLARADKLAEGMAELATDADASPANDEGGAYGAGDRDPWDWQDQ